MAYFIRKFSRNKWMKYKDVPDADVTSDLFGSCIRTSEGTLSIWKVESESDLEDVVLALSTGSETLDTIDILKIEEQDLISSGLNIIESEGMTSFDNMKSKHRDITDLSYSKLKIVSDLILQSVRNENILRFKFDDMKKIFLNGLKTDKISAKDLKINVKKKLDLVTKEICSSCERESWKDNY